MTPRELADALERYADDLDVTMVCGRRHHRSGALRSAAATLRGRWPVTRRLIGWRVRWEWFTPRGEWTPKCGLLVTLPEARRHVQLFHGHTIYRNVRVMRVFRRNYSNK